MSNLFFKLRVVLYALCGLVGVIAMFVELYDRGAFALVVAIWGLSDIRQELAGDYCEAAKEIGDAYIRLAKRNAREQA